MCKNTSVHVQALQKMIKNPHLLSQILLQNGWIALWPKNILLAKCEYMYCLGTFTAVTISTLLLISN